MTPDQVDSLDFKARLEPSSNLLRVYPGARERCLRRLDAYCLLLEVRADEQMGHRISPRVHDVAGFARGDSLACAYERPTRNLGAGFVQGVAEIGQLAELLDVRLASGLRV